MHILLLLCAVLHALLSTVSSYFSPGSVLVLIVWSTGECFVTAVSGHLMNLCNIAYSPIQWHIRHSCSNVRTYETYSTFEKNTRNLTYFIFRWNVHNIYDIEDYLTAGSRRIEMCRRWWYGQWWMWDTCWRDYGRGGVSAPCLPCVMLDWWQWFRSTNGHGGITVSSPACPLPLLMPPPSLLLLLLKYACSIAA